MRERRQNPIGRAATASVPRITLGGLRLAVLDLEQTASFMIDMVFPQRQIARPLYLTSANGEVLARCSTEPMTDRLFRAADLFNVGVIKTSGGLFNFLSGARARAPRWMQQAGLEWAWRIWLEPRRLFWRYLSTNPRALYLLFNNSRPQVTDRSERD